MPITYRFDDGLNCLLARFVGDVTADELVAFIQRAFSDDRIKPQHLRLNDLRAVTGPREAPDLSRFAQLSARYDTEKPPSRSAIVVGTSIDFGMGRVFLGNLGSAGDNWSVFRDMGEALQWLGLPENLEDLFEDDNGWS